VQAPQGCGSQVIGSLGESSGFRYSVAAGPEGV
jgi:hypothetical protein